MDIFFLSIQISLTLQKPSLLVILLLADIKEQEESNRDNSHWMIITIIFIHIGLRLEHSLCFLDRKRKEKCEMKKMPKQIQNHYISNTKLAKNKRELDGKN
jgi:hypothetical protein